MAVKTSGQITIADLTDGHSVTLTSEAAVLPCDKDGKALAATTFVTQVIANRGTEQVMPTIDQSEITKTAGINSVTVNTNSPYSALSPGISVSISKSAALTNGVGEVTIPVHIEDLTYIKKFSIAASRTGAAGTSMYTYVRYSANADGSNMTTSPTDTTKYIGIYVGTSSSVPAYGSFTWSKYIGDPGTSSYTYVRYSADADGTGFVDSPTANTKYVGVAVSESSTAPANKTAYTWSKYVGDDGQDAISLVIISSAGTIFKNTAIATTLTAHVYKGGVEVTGSDLTALGAINWYKDGGSEAIATGQSLSISAGDVSNKATYEARLEA